MKNSILFIAFILVGLTFSCSKDEDEVEDNENENPQYDFETKIFEGDVLLRTQNEVDSFAALHYTDIEGNLTLQGSPHMEDHIITLNSMISIKKIQKTFTINSTKLQTLEGLHNLESFNAIGIYNNTLLKTIEHILDNTTNQFQVRFIGIDGNKKLENLKGLSKILGIIDEPENGILIQNNVGLQSLLGLEGIIASGRISISNNIDLIDISALKNLKSIKHYSYRVALEIISNPNLETIDFSSLKAINYADQPKQSNPHAIRIEENPKLVSLTFPVLEKIYTSIRVVENSSLQEISANKLQSDFLIEEPGYSSSSIVIQDNESLTLLSFEELKNVYGLYINNNEVLESFNFSSLVSIGRIFILYNDNLKNLNGLFSLSNLNYPNSPYPDDYGDFNIHIGEQYQPMLKDFCGLQNFLPSMLNTWPTDVNGDQTFYNVDNVHLTVQDIIYGNCVVP